MAQSIPHRASGKVKADAIYARYSSHAQDDGTSIDVQTEQCERAAGGACVRYVDRAKTGRALGGRDQLQAMLNDAEAGKIRRVFVWKFSRIGRNLAESASVIQQLEDNGVEVLSATEGSDPFARSIFLAMAEHYSRELASNTRDGLIKRFEQGGFTGGIAPYGYRVTEREGRRVLEVNPEEAATIREAAHWYLCEAVGIKGIAKRLRARGVRSRRGAGWSFTTVRSLLLNPILGGRVKFNVRRMQLNRKTGRRLPRAKVEAEHVERQDESLRILGDETIAKISDRLGRAAAGRTPRAPRGISRFTGLIFCSCGSKTYRTHSANRKGSYDYYKCARHMRQDDCTFKGSIREDEVIAMIRRRFEKIFANADNIIARAVELASESVKGNRDQADRLKRGIAAIESEQARLVELLMDRSIADAAKQAINRKMTEGETRRAELHGSLDRLREQANQNTDELAAMIRGVMAEARENLATASTPEEFNRFAERFVGPLTITPDGKVLPKETPPAEAEGEKALIGPVAGGRINTKRIVRAGIWAEPVAA